MKRILHLIGFALSSLPIALRQGFWRPDIVLVVEPPIACVPGALLAARIGRSKTWLHIQDFEVDAAFDLGLIRSPLGRRLIEHIESWLMARLDRISTISDRMLERLSKKGVLPEKQVLLRNWIDVSQFHPVPRNDALRAELGLPSGKMIALYSGNMGQKQGLETVIETARVLEKEKIQFVMCGEGAARTRLVELAKDLRNISWIPLQPEEKFKGLLNLADIHLLPQRSDVADLVMPSKLGAILASGRAVVAMAGEDTEVAKVVEGRGVVVEPENAELFAGAIKMLAEDARKREQLGQRGREFAVSNLDKEVILDYFLKELRELVSAKKTGQ